MTLKKIVPYILFATMIYLGTRLCFPVTWVEEDGNTSQITKNFNYYVEFSSAIGLPTIANSITGAGAGTGLDADKLDGQQGAYYLAASSGGLVVPFTVFYASMTKIEGNYSTTLSSFAKVDTNYTPKSVFFGSMTAIENNYATTLSSFGKVDNNFTGKSVFVSSMASIENNYATTLSSFGKVDNNFVGKSTFYSSMTSIENNYTTVMGSFSAVDVNFTGKSIFYSSMTSIESNYTQTRSSFNNVDANFTAVRSSFNNVDANIGIVSTKVDNLNWYSTNTIPCAVYMSTDIAGDVCVSTVIIHLNNDYWVIGGEMSGDVTGNAVVIVSSRANGGNWGVIGTTWLTLFNQSWSSAPVTSFSLGAGGDIKSVLISASTLRNVFGSLRVKKWAR